MASESRTFEQMLPLLDEKLAAAARKHRVPGWRLASAATGRSSTRITA